MKLRVSIENEKFDVEVGDVNARPVQVTVNGETFEVFPEEEQRIPSSAPVSSPVSSVPASTPAPAPAGAVPAAGGKSITAPIPGTIISVLVKPGDKVKAGQEVMVLEAMKMKNSLRAPREGTIAAVLVDKGSSVKHGQPLAEYAD